MRSKRTIACVVLASAVLFAACGDDDDDDDVAAADTGAATEQTGGSGTAADASVALGETSLGDVLVDGAGMTLYAFENDTDGAPTCEGECATAWPAAIVTGDPVVGDGLDPATFAVVPALAGGDQLTAGGHPLYTFSGDSAPGDVNGQEVGDVWYAVRADGSLVEDDEGGEADDTATTVVAVDGY
jgi:predicted lipoprotein with Yx(FWY)xxD motif